MSKAQIVEAARILRALDEDKTVSLRTRVFESHVKNKRVLLRICLSVLQHKTALERVLQNNSMRQMLNEPPFKHDEHLLRVAIVELVRNAERTKPSPYITPLESYRNELQQIFEQMPTIETPSTMPSVRWVRVNELKITLPAVVKQLETLGYEQVTVETEIVDKEYRRQLRSLTKQQFLLDPHIRGVIAFSSAQHSLYAEALCRNNELLLQDKSSCMAVECLAPPRGAVCVELCAAPGMKTSLLSQYIDPEANGEGHIYSYDKDAKRLQTMRALIRKHCVRNCTVIQADVLKVNLHSHSKATHAILDPPCTGSGIQNRQHELVDDESRRTQLRERARRLANLQATMLKHMLRMPNLERAVYCTCSVTIEENEQVVHEALQDAEISQYWELEKAVPSWCKRGESGANDEYASIQDKVLRFTSKRHFTNGFFVAVFVRRARASSRKRKRGKSDAL